MHLTTRLAGVVRVVAILALVVLGAVGTAGAATQTLDGTIAPLVRIDNDTGNVVVKTWSRSAVAIDAAPGSVQVDRMQLSVPVTNVPVLQGSIEGPGGVITIPPESFAVSTVGTQQRDVVTISGHVTGPMVVTIPNATALLVVQTVHGTVAIHGYTGGTFVVRVQQGRVRLDRDGGTGFAQIMRGPLLVSNSNFDRLRTRTALGVTAFENCRVRQIQATSITGAIVYDDGAFEPGLARFQSSQGAVAVGVRGGAQLGGRGASVVSDFGGRVAYAVREPHRTDVVVDGGGPYVGASSDGGYVYLYDGTLRDRGGLGDPWQGLVKLFERFKVLHPGTTPMRRVARHPRERRTRISPAA